MTNGGVARVRLPGKAIVLWALPAMASCAASNARVHPELEALLPRLQTIAVLSPGAYVVRADGSGEAEVLEEEHDYLVSEFPSTVVENLREAGFDAQFVEASPYQLQDLYNAFDYAVAEVYRARHDFEFAEGEEGTYRASIGSTARTIPGAGEVDAILCMRIIGLDKTWGLFLGESFASAVGHTAGAALAGIIVTGSASAGLRAAGPYYNNVTMGNCHIVVSLVHVPTGDLLWTNTRDSDDFSRSRVRSLVRSALKELPGR